MFHAGRRDPLTSDRALSTTPEHRRSSTTDDVAEQPELRERAAAAERRGLEALDNGDLDAAVEHLLVAVAAFESLGDLHATNVTANYLGVALAERGETALAMKVWEEIINRGWDSPTAYNCLIRYYRRIDDRTKVQQLYARLDRAAAERTGDFFAAAETKPNGPGGLEILADPPPPGTPRVVVADDEPDVLALMGRILVPSRYEVLTARDGKEALDVILASEPDVIVLDIIMPGRSGLDVLYRVRAEEHRDTGHRDVGQSRRAACTRRAVARGGILAKALQAAAAHRDGRSSARTRRTAQPSSVGGSL